MEQHDQVQHLGLVQDPCEEWPGDVQIDEGPSACCPFFGTTPGICEGTSTFEALAAAGKNLSSGQSPPLRFRCFGLEMFPMQFETIGDHTSLAENLRPGKLSLHGLYTHTHRHTHRDTHTHS